MTLLRQGHDVCPETFRKAQAVYAADVAGSSMQAREAAAARHHADKASQPDINSTQQQQQAAKLYSLIQGNTDADDMHCHITSRGQCLEASDAHCDVQYSNAHAVHCGVHGVKTAGIVAASSQGYTPHACPTGTAFNRAASTSPTGSSSSQHMSLHDPFQRAQPQRLSSGSDKHNNKNNINMDRSDSVQLQGGHTLQDITSIVKTVTFKRTGSGQSPSEVQSLQSTQEVLLYALATSTHHRPSVNSTLHADVSNHDVAPTAALQGDTTMHGDDKLREEEDVHDIRQHKLDVSLAAATLLQQQQQPFANGSSSAHAYGRSSMAPYHHHTGFASDALAQQPQHATHDNARAVAQLRHGTDVAYGGGKGDAIHYTRDRYVIAEDTAAHASKRAKVHHNVMFAGAMQANGCVDNAGRSTAQHAVMIQYV